MSAEASVSAWRYPAFIVSLWVPLVVGIIDVCLSRIWINITHVVYALIVFIAYVFVTVVG